MRSFRHERQCPGCRTWVPMVPAQDCPACGMKPGGGTGLRARGVVVALAVLIGAAAVALLLR